MSAKPALQAAEPTAEYLSKFKALIISKAKDGDLSDEDVVAIFKSARGFAGGKGKARKRAESMAAMGESYQSKTREIQQALDRWYPMPNGYGGKYSIQETFDDHIIVCDWNAMEYWSIPYMVNGDVIEFGNLVEVEQEWVRTSENTKPLTLSEKVAAEQQHTGLMVALWLTPAVAEHLAIDGGEPADSLHITLCYCGDAERLGDVAIARVITEIADLARYEPPLVGNVGGIGRFSASSTSDDLDVFYASVDMPGLVEFRARLSALLVDAGAPPRADHGFTPHITLAYLSADDPLPVDSLPTLTLRCEAVVVSVGVKQTSIPLVARQSPVYGKEGSFRLFNELSQYAEPPEWIPLMPKPGEFSHPEYGKIEITKERNQHFIQNFKDGVYQNQLPINSEHKPDEHGAYGWITDMRLNTDGSIDGRTQWTDLGDDAVRKDRFKYISPEWFDEWTSKSTGETHQDVLSGAALTVRPFFKEDSLRPLVANEAGLHALEDSRNLKPKGRITGVWNEGQTTRSMTAFEPIQKEGKTMADPEKKTEPTVAKGMSEDETKRFTELEAKFTEQENKLKTLTEQLTAKDTELKEATGQVKTMREDMRRTRLTAMTSGWLGKPEEHVSMMEFIADNEEKGEESERFKSYVERQRAFAEQAKTGKLFAELGHDGEAKAASSALARMNAEADKLVAADPKLTHAQAFNQVMEKQPQLYNEYRAEQQ